MTKGLLASIVAICFVGLSAERAFAQASTFMLVPGIAGDSVSAGHDRWIDVFSVTQTFDALTKSASVCSLAVGKGLDSAGPRLWAAAVTGQLFNQIQLDLLKQGDTPTKFYEILLINARVAAITTTPNQFMEHLTLVAESVTVKFFPQNPDGSIGQPITASVSCK
jgi:type VI protein secretion system component Hcp